MNKFLKAILFLSFVFLLSTTSVLAQSNEFLCVQNDPDISPLFDTYIPDYDYPNNDCAPGFEETVAACEASSDCDGVNADCVATCQATGSGANVVYGGICEPGIDNCSPDPQADFYPVTCRITNSGAYRCLKDSNPGYPEGTSCADNSECTGYADGIMCESGRCGAEFQEVIERCNQTTLGGIGVRGGCVSTNQYCRRFGLGSFQCTELPSCNLSAEVVGNDVTFTISSCDVDDVFEIDYEVIIFDSSDNPIFVVAPGQPFPIHAPGSYSAGLRQSVAHNGTIVSVNIGNPSTNFQIGGETETEIIPEVVVTIIQLCRDSNNRDGFPTALGCLNFEDSRFFTAALITIGIGIAGGVAIITIAISSFLVMTSAGDPRKTQTGKDLLTSSIGGLLLILLATLIIRLFGQTLLGLF